MYDMLSAYKSDKVLEKLPIPRAERVAKEDVAETLKIMTTGFDEQDDLTPNLVDLNTGKRKKKVGLDSSYIVRLSSRDETMDNDEDQRSSDFSMDSHDTEDSPFDSYAPNSSNKKRKRRNDEIVFHNNNPVYMPPGKICKVD